MVGIVQIAEHNCPETYLPALCFKRHCETQSCDQVRKQQSRSQKESPTGNTKPPGQEKIPMSFTYEQIEELGQKVLRRYCGNKYQVHELVNAVWLTGRAQKAANILRCITLMKWDAIDYMRRCEHRSKRRPLSFEAINEASLAEGGRVRDVFTSTEEGPPDKAISSELRQYMMQGLNCLERLILSMSWSGFSTYEINNVAGYSQPYIWRVQKMVYEISREKIRCYNKDTDAE